MINTDNNNICLSGNIYIRSSNRKIGYAISDFNVFLFFIIPCINNEYSEKYYLK